MRNSGAVGGLHDVGTPPRLPGLSNLISTLRSVRRSLLPPAQKKTRLQRASEGTKSQVQLVAQLFWFSVNEALYPQIRSSLRAVVPLSAPVAETSRGAE